MIDMNKLGPIHEIQLDCDWNGATGVAGMFRIILKTI